ncbi:hypothetical protein [Campylobacter concisus]|uniref:hypothetical protein n=1 Tax=Campylobacter concisus TaxID=199 RepID=UPI000CD8F327|nr:hypothetical protein [Campylobacter concisus]DAR16507.1 MAG TPA: Protein of unknown function (DUF3037) [Caudoviricetes sp.]DAX66847.1 MAG TPA: Protein of unknown function (DUF3037) [Caudoviricetes sp.]
MKLTKYKIIHWYMNKLSLEFLNIGVVVFDDTSFKFKLIDDTLLKKMASASFIDKSVLIYTINYINNLLSTISSEKELDQALSKEYFDSFRFSSTQFFNAFDSLEIELEELFYRYIYYKFENKRTKPQKTKENIKEAIQELAKREFKNHIKIKNLNGFDFSISIKDREYPSILGSIESKDDISRAFNRQLEIPNFRGIYGITTPELRLTNKAEMFKQALTNIGYSPRQFADKDQIYNSLEQLLVAG